MFGTIKAKLSTRVARERFFTRDRRAITFFTKQTQCEEFLNAGRVNWLLVERKSQGFPVARAARAPIFLSIHSGL